MISVYFVTNPDRKEIKLHVKGHAEAGEPGKDIVCAAASVLAYTIARNEQKQKLGDILKKVWIKEKPGELRVAVTAAGKSGYTAAMISFLTVVEGYKMLEETYPDKVKVYIPGIKKAANS